MPPVATPPVAAALGIVAAGAALAALLDRAIPAAIPAAPPAATPPFRARHLALERFRAARARERAEVAPPSLAHLAGAMRAFEGGGRWDALLDIGVAYARGGFPHFAPDARVAAAVLNVAARAPDPGVAAVARARLAELVLHRWEAGDVRGPTLPPQVGRVAIAVAGERIARAPLAALAPLRRPTPRMFVDTRGGGDETPPPAVPAPAPAPARDDQNVHDHGVVRSLVATVRALREEVGDAAEGLLDVTVQRVRDGVLRADVLPPSKARALEVLDALGDAPHSTLGVGEREALRLVWAKMQTLPPASRSNAVDTLTEQLASGVESGAIVCSTGKIARVLGALDGLPFPEPAAVRPVWAVAQELMGLAARTRERALEGASPAEREAYEGGGEGGEAVRRRMEAAFRERARQEYGDDLGLDPGAPRGRGGPGVLARARVSETLYHCTTVPSNTGTL